MSFFISKYNFFEQKIIESLDQVSVDPVSEAALPSPTLSKHTVPVLGSASLPELDSPTASMENLADT